MTGTYSIGGDLGVVEENGKWYLADKNDIVLDGQSNSWVLKDGTTTAKEIAPETTNTNTHDILLADSGTTTLSSGTGTVTTNVPVNTNSHFDVWPSPPSGVDIAVSLENNGTNYVIHFEENTSSIGNPSIGWQLVESQL